MEGAGSKACTANAALQRERRSGRRPITRAHKRAAQAELQFCLVDRKGIL